MTRRARWWLALCGLGLLLPLSAAQAGTPVCGRLCATNWALDPAASTDADEALDDAMDDYKDEKLKRRRAPSGDYAAIAKAELDDSLGPMRQRPVREELRQELQRRLDIPKTLHVTQDGNNLLLDEGRGTPRRFDLDESYSRVDSVGTAEVKSRWSSGSFTVTEDYRKGRSNREAYAVDGKGDRLVVTRTLSRPGLPKIVVKSVYRPAF